MRRILTIISCCISLVGCTLSEFDPETWAIDPVLELSESGLIFTNSDREGVVVITTNYQEFEIIASEEWCKWKVDGDNLHITVDPNETIEQRKATISVRVSRGSKSLSRDLSIVQFGGYWDVVGEFSVFWSSNITDSQKQIVCGIFDKLEHVKGSTFKMGGQGINPLADNYYEYYDADDVHEVTLSDYYIGRYEITQEEWNTIMGTNNCWFKDDKLPVENITWEEAVEFTKKLSDLTCRTFKLPTEAQWEYAARGGMKSMEYLYPGSNNYSDVGHHYGGASINENDPMCTTVVGGMYKHNELNLYDMAGNVSEFCLDWYGDYNISASKDPMGPSTGEYHVVRGGSFIDLSLLGCVYQRWTSIGEKTSKPHSFIGLRVVLIP